MRFPNHAQMVHRHHQPRRHPHPSRLLALALGGFIATAAPLPPLQADDDFIPRRQEKPPGPALTPQEALEKMTVPEGFVVELVASEPEIVNPVAMTIDEQGRIWITESVEYPRHAPGPGEDRIKVLEDTTGDGVADKVTVFADGLNIPCGIAVGHGGVWVSNAPDILFMQDTTGDGVADHIEVVVTGFGRADTHELPNSLTWGPDGWLYGLNGVFNPSVIRHQGKEHRFTCAVFRIHPRTREFEVFAEGTSNPWGIAFDPNGSLFLSACVIDHLWHVTETGYYRRQSGAYPPFTWRIESIVEHRHQMAAYCGLVYFDSDAFPEDWRDVLFMGNIHGGAINGDVLERRGSTYFATPRDDIFTANDVWFMPVSQKVGADGHLYLLDWYDRYHCYQDAMRDPEGVNRTHGRLWRLRYAGDGDREPVRGPFPNLGEASDDQLVDLLGAANVYHRETAQRLLQERDSDHARPRLQELALADDTPHKHRMHALFALVGAGQLDESFHLDLLNHDLPILRAWGARAAGNARNETPAAVTARLLELTADPEPDVLLQVAIAAGKIDALDTADVLAQVLVRAGDDPLIPRIVWQNLHPELEQHGRRFVAAIADADLGQTAGVREILPRAVERLLAVGDIDADTIAGLLQLLLEQEQHGVVAASLEQIGQRVRSGEVRDARLATLREPLDPVLDDILAGGPDRPLFFDTAVTAASWRHPRAIEALQNVLQSPDQPEQNRLAAVEALISIGDEGVLESVGHILHRDSGRSGFLARSVLQALGRSDHDAVPAVILGQWDQLDEAERPVAVETLTQRGAWSIAMLEAIAGGEIDRDALNLNQVAGLMAGENERIHELVLETWGNVRLERNPDREQLIAEVHERARRVPGDPVNGRIVYQNACAACHLIHGEGNDIGPDLTHNGRGSFEQLLSNILDPNLVIGPAYQLRTVTLHDGRVLAGMIAEENDQRVVLKMIGGQSETIARDQVAQIVTAPVSFMPEGLEQAMTEQDMIDLLAYLSYDLPPDHPEATLIAGAPTPGYVDPARVQLPAEVENLLLEATISSNMPTDSHGLRGEPHHMIFDPSAGAFIADSEWHEFGVEHRATIGVVAESDPIWWLAEWDQPVEANLILLSGSYPNQRQPDTGWRIELRVDGEWETLEQGIGGWYDSGRFGWGGPGRRARSFDAFRVSLFSRDDNNPLESIHLRGEPGVSWVIARIDGEVVIEPESESDR